MTFDSRLVCSWCLHQGRPNTIIDPRESSALGTLPTQPLASVFDQNSILPVITGILYFNSDKNNCYK
jgi:hypothetical protein